MLYKDALKQLQEQMLQEKTAAAIPGLPDRRDMGDLSMLHEDDIATLIRQLHRARRAGVHEDLRLGGPGGLLSWAVPKQLPTDDAKRLAIRQPVHDWSYKDFHGRLRQGYGKGTVEKMEESPVVILKNSGDHIMFTRGDMRDAPIYNLRKTKDDNWLLFISRKGQPDVVRMYPKEHFKSVPMDKVPALIASGAAVTRKIDGAGALLYLGDHGAEAYGIRTNSKGEKPSYTDAIGGLRSLNIPKDLRGTLLRAEVFGQRAGQSIGPNELGGILNATTRNAVYKKRGDGIRMLLAALAVHRNGVDDYDPKAVEDIVRRLGAANVIPVTRYTGKDALEAIERMRNGDDTLTNEGVVIHQPGQRPLKAKFKEDADVVIRDVFKAGVGPGVRPRAGGFSYSLPGSDKVIGRVGTGFDHAMLEDMLANPDRYVGRTARIQSQQQYPSGAYRAPSFIALKED